MLVGGRTVVLDNFRELFCEYSVDIQDVIRSAILDGVDILDYIGICKDDPFRLDQIRLGMKEGVVAEVFSFSGENIYKVRKIIDSKDKMSVLIRQLEEGSLSDKHINYLLKWLSEGRRLGNLMVSHVPKDMLGVFDKGIGYGIDMSNLLSCVGFGAEYVGALVEIKKNRRDIFDFVDGGWSIAVLKEIGRNSNNHMGWYDEWLKALDKKKGLEWVILVRELYQYMFRLPKEKMLSVSEVRSFKVCDSLKVLVKAAKEGMDLKQFVGRDEFACESLYQELKGGIDKKISGNLRGKRN